MQSIKKLENMGYKLKVDNGKIIFNFKNGTIPSFKEAEKLIINIKDNKTKAIDLLMEKEAKANHKEAIRHNYTPYSFNECYSKQLTKSSHIFIQRIDLTSLWTSYRLTFNERNDISTEREIIQDTDFQKVLNRTEVYIKNFKKYLNLK